MKVVGLTGGIGSGKTTVASMFKKLGVPVYIADAEAKKLTNTSATIKKKLITLLGKEAYCKNKINKVYVAQLIFNDKNLLEKVNQIIHPEVTKHFLEWKSKQKAIYCIKEAAILFENGSYKNCDYTILVIAPLNERINRVIRRDKSSKKDIISRINNQWTDQQKALLADITIENTNLEETQKKVKELHLNLLKMLNK